MKKIALVLALLICLPFALFGCGKHSSAENCAKAYLNAMLDSDYETVMDLTPRFDESLMKKFDDDYTERDYDDFYKDAERSCKDEADEEIKEREDYVEFDVNFTITKTLSYTPGDESFDSVVDPDYCGERLQPLYEAIEEIAYVYFYIEGSVQESERVDPEYNCYSSMLALIKIDGGWYLWDTELPDYD